MRNENALTLPNFSSIKYGYNSFRYLGAKIWNHLPNVIKDSPSSVFCCFVGLLYCLHNVYFSFFFLLLSFFAYNQGQFNYLIMASLEYIYCQNKTAWTSSLTKVLLLSNQDQYAYSQKNEDHTNTWVNANKTYCWTNLRINSIMNKNISYMT